MISGRLPFEHGYEVMAAAADLIENDGLWKGRFWQHYGEIGASYNEPGDPCCALGALYAVADRSPFEHFDFADTVFDDIHLHARRLLPVADIADWNDADARTAGDVVAFLRAAASADYLLTQEAAE